MIPHDWKSVAKACLSGGQYVLWRAKYSDAAQQQADVNRRHGLRRITKNTLLKIDDYKTVGDQLNLDKRTLDQVTGCAIKAWQSLSQEKKSISSFSNIKQKPEEPYEDFMARLIKGVHRVISNGEAADILIRQLAFENANSTCQAVLRPIKKNGHIADFIRQCAGIGPAVMQGAAIPAAIKGDSYQQTVQTFLAGRNSNNQGRNAGSSRACFSCGQERHFTCTCPQKTANSSQPNPASKAMTPNLPKSLCPRC